MLPKLGNKLTEMVKIDKMQSFVSQRVWSPACLSSFALLITKVCYLEIMICV